MRMPSADAHIHWLLAPPPDFPLEDLLDAIRTPSPHSAPTSGAWAPIHAPGPRRIFRRAAAASADYLKFFPEDRFSFRRRSGLAIWPTPARRHLHWTRALESLGVRVAPLIAAGELKPSSPFRQPASFIITRSPIGARTIDAALRDNALTSDARIARARELLSLARRLHAHNIARIDLKAANLLIYSPEEPLVLFDIDRFVRPGPFARRARIAKDDERVRAACARLLEGTGLTLADLA